MGDHVLLSTKHLKLQNPDGTHKLLPCWIGLFPVTAVVGKAAVKLDLSQIQLKIHYVLHVSLVKYRSDGTWHPPKPQTGFEGEDVYKADTLLAKRERKSGKRTLVSYLVKWHGSGPESNTWEPAANILDKQLITDY